MNEYLVTGAPHYERDPDFNSLPEGEKQFRQPVKEYVKGKTVKSDRPLDLIFPEKFEKVVPGVTKGIEVSAERKKAVADLIATGSWDDGDREFLETAPDRQFGKFQSAAGVAQAPKAEAEGDKKAEEKRVRVKSHLGEDVTDDFPAAAGAGLAVFKNAQGKLQVADPKHPNKALGKGPVDREGVDAFVKSWTEE